MKPLGKKAASLFLVLAVVVTMLIPVQAYAENVTGASEQQTEEIGQQKKGTAKNEDASKTLEDNVKRETNLTEADSEERFSLTASGDLSDTTVNLFKAELYSGAKRQEDGTWTVNPTENRNGLNTVTYKVHYSMSGGTSHAPGTVVIRIPSHIFFTRDGKSADSIRLDSIPKAPSIPSGNDSYNWTTDPTTGDILIVNCKEISGANEMTFYPSYTVAVCADGTAGIKDLSKADFDAELKVSGNDGKAVITKNDSAEQVAYDTKAVIDYTHKTAVSRSDELPDGWGEKPANADDYFYVVWKIFSVPNTNNTQPYTITIKDTPDDPGEVVGYRRTDGKLYNISSKPEMGAFSKEAPTYTVSNPTPDRDNYGYYTYVLIKYPKSAVEDGEKHVFKNTAESVLTGSDDGIVTTADDDAEFTWSNLSFREPPGDISLSKYGWSESPGAINLLENGHDVTVSASGSSDNNGFFDNHGDVKVYRLTLEKNGNASRASDYGKRAYSAELVDDMFFLKGNNDRQLTADDYEISEIRADASFWDYSLNSAGTKYDYSVHSNKTEYPDVDILGTKDFKKWEKIGTLSWSSGTGLVTLNNGSSVAAGNKDKNSIAIPSGYVGVKLRTKTTMAGFSPKLYTRLTLKPSAYVKQCVQGADEVEVRNVNSLIIHDADGALYFRNFGSNYGNSYIRNRDNELYGNTVYHRTAIGKLTRFNTTSYMSKKMRVYDDSKNSRARLDCTVILHERMIHSGGHDDSFYVDNGYFTPQTEGTFYDLLPYGTSLNENSVKVSPYNAANASKFKIDVKVSYRENWRGSGRTMAIFHVKVPDGLKNYSSNLSEPSWLESGFQLQYSLYYPYESIADFGKNILNSVAYETGNDSIGSGYADNGGTLTEKELLADLNNDGNPEGTANKNKYAQAVVSIPFNIASKLELTKTVKGPRNSDWGTGQDGSVIVAANEDYEYRLRFQSANDTTTSQIILFDALETYHPENGTEQWQGIYQGLDLSQPLLRGAKPVIYYSTKNDLNLDEHHDLTDTTIWTTTEPADKASIHAIAIDLRKAQDGSDFTLPQNAALIVKIKMKAPPDISEVNTLSRKDAHAYNNVYLSNYTQAGSEDPTKFFINHNYTQVGLPPINEGSLKLTKISKGHDTPDDAEFTITGPNDYSKTVKYSELKDGSITLSGLPVGTYTVKESKAGVDGYTLTVDGMETAEITKDDTAEVTVTNTYTRNTGSLKLTKISKGHDTPDDAEFTITGPNDYSKTVKYSELKEGSITLSGLPVGTYTVKENKADVDGYTLTLDGKETAEITKGDTAEITLANTYKPNDTPTPPIDKSGKAKVPETGDESNLSTWLVLFAGAGVVLAVILARRNKKGDGKQQ